MNAGHPLTLFPVVDAICEALKDDAAALMAYKKTCKGVYRYWVPCFRDRLRAAPRKRFREVLIDTFIRPVAIAHGLTVRDPLLYKGAVCQCEFSLTTTKRSLSRWTIAVAGVSRVYPRVWHHVHGRNNPHSYRHVHLWVRSTMRTLFGPVTLPSLPQ